MSHLQGIFSVVSATQLTPKGFCLEIHCPEVVKEVKAGQFVHIKCEGYFLRRPISICSIDIGTGNLNIVFEVRGEGTEVLSNLKVGDSIDMIAPLGNGFTLLEGEQKVLLVGGGIGTPPMLALAKEYGDKATAILGFRTKEVVLLEEEFIATGASLAICTDDGTMGHHGFVTDIVKEEIPKGVTAIYACGPMPMLKAVGQMAIDGGIFCELSLEERMGCGVGACLVCVCKTKEADGEHHRCVCKEGPVFKAEEVIF